MNQKSRYKQHRIFERSLRISEAREEISADPAARVLDQIRSKNDLRATSHFDESGIDGILNEVDQILQTNQTNE